LINGAIVILGNFVSCEMITPNLERV